METQKGKGEEKEVFRGLDIVFCEAQVELEAGSLLDCVHSAYLLCETFTRHYGSI